MGVHLVDDCHIQEHPTEEYDMCAVWELMNPVQVVEQVLAAGTSLHRYPSRLHSNNLFRGATIAIITYESKRRPSRAL